MIFIGASQLDPRYFDSNANMDSNQQDEEAGLTSDCILDIPHVITYMDSERIFQVIRNLLLNAVKYTMQGQAIEIVVSAHKEVSSSIFYFFFVLPMLWFYYLCSLFN